MKLVRIEPKAMAEVASDGPSAVSDSGKSSNKAGASGSAPVLKSTKPKPLYTHFFTRDRQSALSNSTFHPGSHRKGE